MKQSEKPGTNPAELAATLGMSSAEGIKVSGGQIENFREGWAKRIMPTSTVSHYFVRGGEFASAEALCGTVASVRWLYGEGNYERCQRCDALRLKSMKRWPS